MKFLSFVRPGEPGFGALVGNDGIADLRPILGVSTLKSAIVQHLLPQSLPKSTPDFSLSDVSFLSRAMSLRSASRMSDGL